MINTTKNRNERRITCTVGYEIGQERKQEGEFEFLKNAAKFSTSLQFSMTRCTGMGGHEYEIAEGYP